MCLAAIAIGQHPRFAWLLASNRDEYFSRAAAPLAWWQAPGSTTPVLSGRDLSAGGTWLGLDATGRLALVTNVREPGRNLAAAPSRGELVLQWLQGRADAAALQALGAVPRNGYNLFTAELGAPLSAAAAPAARWLSNRPQPQQRALGAGVFGLSNAALDTPWPKVRQLKQALADSLRSRDSASALLADAFAALAQRSPAPDADLPATGVPLERERQLSPAFIRIGTPATGVYGTRCSTVVLVERHATRQTVHVVERSYAEDGAPTGEVALQFEMAAPKAA